MLRAGSLPCRWPRATGSSRASWSSAIENLALVAFAIAAAVAGIALFMTVSPRTEELAPTERRSAVVIGVASGICCGALASRVGFGADLSVLAPAVLVAVVAGVIDARTKLVPNRLTYPALVVLLALVSFAALSGASVSIVRGLLGALAYGGGLLVVALAAPRAMGMGDVKVAAVFGLALASFGWSWLGVGVAAGILAGGLGAMVALALGRDRRSTMPFGPFLALGMIVAALFAPEIAARYMGLIR